MKPLLVLAAMLCFTIVANLLMKLGSTTEGPPLSALFNARTIAGLACFATAGLLYAVVLRWLPLNVAQSFASVQFVGVILGAALILGERIAPGQWVGVGLIAAGIFAIGWSTR